jgi:hypothetical protein
MHEEISLLTLVSPKIMIVCIVPMARLVKDTVAIIWLVKNVSYSSLVAAVAEIDILSEHRNPNRLSNHSNRPLMNVDEEDAAI